MPVIVMTVPHRMSNNAARHSTNHCPNRATNNGTRHRSRPHTDSGRALRRRWRRKCGYARE
jgi:hypothetical protein